MDVRKNKIILKASFYDDIRRITIDDSIGFKDLKKILKKLFKPSFKFNMGYLDEEEDFINIRSDLDLQTAMRQATKNVLRIKMEEVPIDSRQPSEAEGVPGSENLTNEGRLRQMILETVMSQPVLDVLAQRLLPQLVEAIREEKKPVTQFDFSFLADSIAKTVCEQRDNQGTNGVNEETEDEPEEEHSDEPHVPTVSEIKPSFNEAAPEEEQKEKQENAESKDEEEELADPEQFVMLQNVEDEPKQQGKASLSGLRLLLSMFNKISRSKNKDQAEEEEDTKEDVKEGEFTTLDEALARLIDMGFADLEANLQLLRFHKKYNEGLDEVIEDLLLQYQEKAKQQVAQAVVEPAKN